MKKRWTWVVVVVLVVISVIVLSDSKGMAVNHVLRHQEQMTAHALQCLKDPENSVSYRSWSTRYSLAYNVVQFQVQYRGFGSQFDERGFYYSPDDTACGLGNELDQEYRDNGVRFIGEGDNYTDVEKITDHWYWYEMHW